MNSDGTRPPAIVSSLIRALKLRPHPEGGFYRETWRSAGRIGRGELPRAYRGSRAYATSILYLLPAGTHSRWHRLRSDETWFHHLGGPLEVVELPAGGRFRRLILGPRPGRGHLLQHTVKAGTWFAARPLRGASFSLAGCVVTPGFEYADFELADPAALSKRFRKHARAIARFA